MGARAAIVEKGVLLEGPYRYLLWRRWTLGLRSCLFVMLNPSTADAERDDPTIRRCVGFARRWGYGSLEVVNLFAYRSADPAVLRRLGAAAIGPQNDRHIREAAEAAGLVVAAWGARADAGRAVAVLRLLERSWGQMPRCLGLTKSLAPKHPLYVPALAKLRQVR